MKLINKNITLFFVLCFLLLNGLFAQDAPNRTVETIIADALVQLPAESLESYNNTMSSLVSSGEEGLISLVQRLRVPDTQANEPVEFAINGWINFIYNDPPKKRIAANALAKTLNSSIDNQVKAFVMRQLELIGTDAQIDILEKFISNEDLSAPAVQALTALQSKKANSTLLRNLKATRDNKIKINLITALAKNNYSKAESTFLALLNSQPSEDLYKVLIPALGAVGTKKSIVPLRQSAETKNFVYDEVNSTGAYLKLLERLSLNKSKDALNETLTLLEKASKSGRQDLQTAAAQLLLLNSRSNKNQLWTRILESNDLVFLTNSLNFYSPFAGKKKHNEIISKLSTTTSHEAKEALIYWLGDQRAESAVPVISKHLTSDNKFVRTASIKSLVKINNNNAINELLSQFKRNDPEVIDAIAANLITVDNPILSESLFSVFPESSVEGKLAAIDVLVDRQMINQNPTLIYNLINSKENRLRTKALSVLKSVSTKENLSELFDLLERAEPEHIKGLQDAVISSLTFASKKEQYELILSRLNGSNSKFLYYDILAAIDFPEVPTKLLSEYNSQSGKNKVAAFDAINKLKSFDTVYTLLDIARKSNNNTELSKAVSTCIDLIAKSNKNDEVKALYLREIMEYAQDDNQRKAILTQLSNLSSYKVILYASQFLDVPALKEEAAVAVMNATLSNPDFLDENTAKLLEKSSKTLDNPDAVYQREAISKFLNENKRNSPYVRIFNEKDIIGWKGVVGDPLTRAKMSATEYQNVQVAADTDAKKNWIIKNGVLINTGTDKNLCTIKKYADFELLIDWKLFSDEASSDAGIYLRGTPLVMIAKKDGNKTGAGGLYYNIKNKSEPSVNADEKLGEWNTFRIKMIGERVTVWLNGQEVVNNIVMENFWDKNSPIPSEGQLELYSSGGKIAFRDIYIREIEPIEPFKLSRLEEKEGYKILFDGTNLNQWTGNTYNYVIEDGNIVLNPKAKNESGTRNLYTKEEYDDFILRFEFMLFPRTNNGIGIRTPMTGDAAYVGMELQILENDHPSYQKLKEYQFHGSVYGVIPAKKGFLKPTGEWNYQEIIAKGDNIKVILNGTVILDGNIREASKDGTLDKRDHPGLLNKKGHIALLGHGTEVKFRNIRIKEL
ncbi:MAG: DUF1080 domain-containing protein [Bacteroidales bacterium]|nr:DUF1080 domain-containing protein [Bacteroidales bacterium]